MYKVLLLVFLFTESYSCYAQEHIYTNYNTNNGLSSSQVYDITQDKNGYLWFATDRGLTRYDGYTFQQFGIEDGLTDIVVFNFFEQPDGKIWCSTFNKKLFYYDPDINRFLAYAHNDKLQYFPSFNVINSLKIGEANSLFVNFKASYGYVEIDSSGVAQDYTYRDTNIVSSSLTSTIEDRPFTFKSTREAYPPILKSPSITREFEGTLPNYSSMYDRESQNLFLIGSHELRIINTVTEQEIQIKSAIQQIISGQYDDKHIWVGLQHGGCKVYNFKGEVVHHFLPKKSVTKIFTDHEGGIWLGTIDDGVFYIKNPHIRIYNEHTQNQSNHAYRLTKNSEDEIYVSYHNGNIFKRKSYGFELIKTTPENLRSTVQYYHKPNRLIVGAANHIWEEELGELDDYINPKVVSDNTNEYPLLGHRFFWKLTSTEPVQINYERLPYHISDVEYSPSGYYFATIKGLFEFKDQELIPMKGQHPLFGYRIDDIDLYGKTYFMASLGAGLIVKTPDTIFNIKQSDGLNSDVVTQVHVVNEQEVYVATNTGLNRVFLYPDHSYNLTGICTNDGIPSNEINDIEISKDTVWITTKKGLCSLHASLLTPSSKPLTNWLSIKGIEVDNRSLEDLEQLNELPYNTHNIAFKYGAISFKNNNAIIYRYRLLGIEKEWTITQNQTISYPELPPGDYTFEVQAGIGWKNFSTQIQRATFSIATPFWQTWWFYMMVCCSFALATYSFFKFRILTYNKHISKEILRIALKKVRGKKHYVTIKESGVEIKLNTDQIHFIKSSGNYLEVHTKEKMYLTRNTIGNFAASLPDKLEYIRIHRSYLIRVEKVQQKSSNHIRILDQDIPVGKTHKKELERIIF